VSPSVEILCGQCGADTFVRREPVYDGFTKTGERIFCTACGCEYANEDLVPYKVARKPAVFTDSDRSKRVEIFASDEQGRNCRHCRHYVVNPFIQRCAIHHREVQATDICDNFDPPDAGARQGGDSKEL